MIRTPDRRRPLHVRPNGALWDEQAYREYIGEVDRRAPRPVTVERLSKQDPDIVAFEATARGARA